MDDDNSPRKKSKTHHNPSSVMADMEASDMPPSAVHEQHLRKASVNKDRLNKEVQCGITEYVSPHLPGFGGTLKKRYTDFLVNEILPNGKVIHLDNLKKSSDQQPLSQPASKPHEDVPSKFPSTNLNRVEQFSRKKETVYMRHGAGTLSVVDKQAIGPDQAVLVEDRAQDAQDEAAHLVRTGNDDIQERVPVGREELDNGAPEESNAPVNGAPVMEETASTAHPDNTKTAGGWQAYAQSNTDGAASTLSDEDRTLLTTFFDSETVDAILALFNRMLASPLRKARDFGVVKTKPIERETRTEIHQVIRRIFSSRLETTTDDSGAMVITAASSATKSSAWRKDRNSKPQQPKGKLGWAQLGGDHLHFTIYKENRDTMEAISHLARTLKLKPQSFQFAGTKDRRGITVQRASVYRLEAKRLYDAGRTLRQSKVGNFEYHPQGLQLGDLMGNEFVVTLRDCRFQLDEEADVATQVEQVSSILDTVIENFGSNGFINYFGLQRFGSFSTGTHAIGRSMLQGDFKSACEGILSFQPSALAAAQQETDRIDSNISRDDIARASALHAFAETGQSKQALDALPRKFSAEACLVRHLSRPDQRNDYLGALHSISRNLRLMYVHAYQSLVWNIAVSARWKAHGNKVLSGDLVLVTEHPEPSTKPSADNTSIVDQDGEPVIPAEASDRAYTSDEIFTRARTVTEAELASPDCKISIFDIVLPLPGYDILYPANSSADIYKEFMASEEGGGLDPYDMRRKWKDVSLSGSYRKLLAKPLGKVECSVKAYGQKGDDEQFVETDLERLEKMGGMDGGGRGAKSTTEKGAGVGEAGGGGEGQNPTSGNTRPEDSHSANTITQLPTTTAASDLSTQETTTETNDPPSSTTHLLDPKNDKLAVILKMQLGSSTYATMALRELMKEGGVKTWKVDNGGGR
ncbi:MAG: hypothetical protein Q9170_007642 [Blastenia crenularia]